jgi:hypothetical protein
MVIPDQSRSGLSLEDVENVRLEILCLVPLKEGRVSQRWRVPCHDPRLWIHLLVVQGQLIAGQPVSDNVADAQDITYYYSGRRCPEESDLKVPADTTCARHQVS